MHLHKHKLELETWSLPDEIGDHKKLHPSVYESKSSVFNYHHFWCLIVPEAKEILLYEVP